MKKINFLALVALFFGLSSCVDYNLPELNEAPVNEPVNYMLKVNSSVVAVGDTIYGSTTAPILFMGMEKITEAIVPIQCDFGDGTIDGGTQVLHQYKTAGIFSFTATIVAKNEVLKRIVKISAPSVNYTDVLVQLSGNTVGDSAVINILCKKDKIYQGGGRIGNYYIRGDMTDWKRSIMASDTNFVYNGAVYLQFNIKVKNNDWTSFGYYKTINGSSEQWGYAPEDKYWDASKGLFRIYVTGAKIYSSQLVASVPGTCGDSDNIRLDYETNGSNTDSLTIYVNRKNLGNDSTKMGVSYSVDGNDLMLKKVRFLKNTNWCYIKAPVTKSSTVRFKTYQNLTNLVVGNMTESMFYNPGTKDCYLTIAGSVSKVKSASQSAGNNILAVIKTPQGDIYAK